MRKFNGEPDCSNHAVMVRDSLAGNPKRRAVIGTGARKGQTEGHIHAAVESVQFQWDQTLVVIHAENGIEFIFRGAMENCIGRKRTDEDGL